MRSTSSTSANTSCASYKPHWKSLFVKALAVGIQIRGREPTLLLPNDGPPGPPGIVIRVDTRILQNQRPTSKHSQQQGNEKAIILRAESPFMKNPRPVISGICHESSDRQSPMSVFVLRTLESPAGVSADF